MKAGIGSRSIGPPLFLARVRAPYQVGAEWLRAVVESVGFAIVWSSFSLPDCISCLYWREGVGSRWLVKEGFSWLKTNGSGK